MCNAHGVASSGTNAVGRMLGLLGDEWTAADPAAGDAGGDAVRAIHGAPADLPCRADPATGGDDGQRLLARRTYQGRPLRADYVLTPRGRALWPVLVSIWEWERHWVPDHAQRLPAMHHTVCGDDFAPLLQCAACSESVTEKDIGAQWGPSGGWSRSIPCSRRGADRAPTASRARADAVPRP